MQPGLLDPKSSKQSMQWDNYISKFDHARQLCKNLTLHEAVTQYGLLLFGIFNLEN